jgi:hypothetical protein
MQSRKLNYHGFDMGKLTPSSLFYLPCQAENPVDSYFIDHHSPRRVPLDPYMWAGYAANRHQPVQDGAETVAATLAQPVHRAMSATNCPKLRRMRELIADEEVARHRDNLSRRKAAAIERWHGTPAQDRRAVDAYRQRLRRELVAHGHRLFLDHLEPDPEGGWRLHIFVADDHGLSIVANIAGGQYAAGEPVEFDPEEFVTDHLNGLESLGSEFE